MTKFTAYVSGGPVFKICEKVEVRAGMFNDFQVESFNLKTEYKFNAVDILCHMASFGKIYRIEYESGSNEMRCS